MPLPPIPFSNDVQKQAYEDLAKGSMRQFGDALAVIVRRVLSPTYKSLEERALDWQQGSEETENRRRLAAEALDRVPIERRILPAPQIAGPIFRESEFELPETPIWEMWSNLLSRASDKVRADEAHPAFPGIINQLSPQEASLMQMIWRTEKNDPLSYFRRSYADIDPDEVDIWPSPSWSERLAPLPMFSLDIIHLRQLDIIRMASEHHSGEYATAGTRPYKVQLVTIDLTWWGKSFMRAVSER